MSSSRENNAASGETRTDQQLIDAINHGELSAFDVIYWRYRDWVVRLGMRFVGNAEDAMDVLQETFAYLHRKFPGFELRARLTTFLYPVVKNISIAIRRKRRSFVEGEDVLDQVPDARSDRQDLSDLGEVLRGLSEVHREVVLMRFVDGMSLEEIAAALNVPVGTIKSRLHNAIEMLRKDSRIQTMRD